MHANIFSLAKETYYYYYLIIQYYLFNNKQNQSEYLFKPEKKNIF